MRCCYSRAVKAEEAAPKLESPSNQPVPAEHSLEDQLIVQMQTGQRLRLPGSKRDGVGLRLMVGILAKVWNGEPSVGQGVAQ